MSTVLGSIEAYNASRFESRARLLVNQVEEVKTPEEEEEEEEEEEDGCSSSTTMSSWIGMNSDDGGGCDGGEVQSSFNGRSLDTMESLQEVLPMRRGISSFYNGKSKSFTSLAEASSTSTVEEIAKPENAYTRRRRNLLAINHAWDRKRLKRPIRSSKTTLTFLAVAMASISATTTPCPCPCPLLPPP
ncbi:hypothetical protein V6N13_098046 [Hibiscus sabdariffa]|uniref:Uncharacterized protein n=1 Tax=Hibiscus sabdariffa TaxID=183260 RepID=A0ABR2NVP8_9ROSI